jgi:YD repeat-containing protein
VWASSPSATGPCGLVNTAGTLTGQGVSYTANYSYDAQDRLTSAPLGAYSYDDPAHLHAATAVGYGTAYTASYDAAGDMVCRAPTSAASCGGSSSTGQVLAYDNERRLTSWQNTPSSPTTTAQYAYDGAGQRVAQQVTAGSTTTTTRYLAGGLEDVTLSGSPATTTMTLTKDETVAGVCGVGAPIWQPLKALSPS